MLIDVHGNFAVEAAAEDYRSTIESVVGVDYEEQLFIVPYDLTSLYKTDQLIDQVLRGCGVYRTCLITDSVLEIFFRWILELLWFYEN